MSLPPAPSSASVQDGEEVTAPIELIPLRSGALTLPPVSVRVVVDGTAGGALPVALTSAAMAVLVQPHSHALFAAGQIAAA